MEEFWRHKLLARIGSWAATDFFDTVRALRHNGGIMGWRW